MSAYIVVDVTIHDPQRYKEYVELVPSLIEKHQGRPLVRGGEVEVIEGDWRPQRLVVLEFPSKGHAEAFLQDPDYASVGAIRHAAATSNLIVVEGLT
ncbi:MAG: DUF1330 domain-containing protein [Gammaproteobacteria bacterium]|nr:DUF1330 domain-containing protein [Gammaproteobacteria bacterium]